MRKDLSVEYANVHLVRCKPENTIGWRSMNKTPSRQLGLKRTLNMSKDHAAARHRGDESHIKIVPICGV